MDGLFLYFYLYTSVNLCLILARSTWKYAMDLLNEIIYKYMLPPMKEEFLHRIFLPI